MRLLRAHALRASRFTLLQVRCRDESFRFRSTWFYVVRRNCIISVLVGCILFLESGCLEGERFLISILDRSCRGEH